VIKIFFHYPPFFRFSILLPASLSLHGCLINSPAGTTFLSRSAQFFNFFYFLFILTSFSAVITAPRAAFPVRFTRARWWLAASLVLEDLDWCGEGGSRTNWLFDWM